ncbi:hypothetical protein [Arthrobacter terrae]|nr:hypothetical protein [Arthrobacter terrae]
MRITIREDEKFLTVINPDHQVTEIEKRAAQMMTDSFLDDGPLITYEEALDDSRRLAIRSVT